MTPGPPVDITAVTLTRVLLPLRTPFRTAFGTWDERDVLLVRVDATTPDGPVAGWGECVAPRHPDYTNEYTAGCHAVLVDHLLPRLWRHLDAEGPVDATGLHAAWHGVRGHHMARAAVEMAVLDAQCRAADVSLADRLGAHRDRVEVGVVLGADDDVSTLVAAAEDAVAAGYRRLKCKIHPGGDAEPVAAVVDAVRGADAAVDVMVDANGSYRPTDEAHRRTLQHLDTLGLVMIEQPFPVGTLTATRDLLADFATPVCLDGSLDSPAAVDDALAVGAFDVAAIKPGRLGGILPALAVADRCRRHGRDTWHGGMLETGIGRAAALATAATDAFTRPADLSASDRYWATDLVTEPATLRSDGTIAVPTGPGLGVDVDPSVLDDHTMSAQDCRR